jgi:ABC-type branched-subunit amino acid transport system ATPase component
MMRVKTPWGYVILRLSKDAIMVREPHLTIRAFSLNKYMLEIKNIHKSFGGVQAVNGCSFKVPENKITALIGPNGAGKTTLFDIISGILDADSGEIFLAGKKITGLRPDQIANVGVSRTFQHVRLFKNLTILDHLLMSQDNLDLSLIRNLLKTQKVQQQNYKEYIKDFGLKKNLNTKVSDLSYGQRKLLSMAVAFLKTHKILLLDEPVAGVNKVIQKEIEITLMKFKEEKKTILVIEHDMDFVRKLADWVIVMDQGRVLAEGEPGKVLKDPKVLEAYLGE